MPNIQFDADGRLKHFIGIEGLPRHLLFKILDTAQTFINPVDHTIQKVPILRGKTVFNLFFEPSTRTRTTFELAAKRLSADVVNFNMESSSNKKGESLTDLLHNLEAMYADLFVVRHHQSGAAYFIAQHLSPQTRLINAGDGQHEHPTQAMLDMYTIRHYKHDFVPLKVAIVGDIFHSRVARSQIYALSTLGVAEIRVICPKTLSPVGIESMGVKRYHDLTAGLKNVDVVIMLRLQYERMTSALLPSECEYFRCYGLTHKALEHAAKDAIVMHPGPINRGVEIASSVVDSPRAVILQQVSFGIAVRMAVMAMILGLYEQ